MKIQHRANFRGTNLGSMTGTFQRVWRFVQGVCQRHAVPRRLGWRIPDLILRKSSPTIMLRRIQRDGDFFFVPRLALTIMSLGNPRKDKNQQIPQLPLAPAKEQIILRKYAKSNRFVMTQQMVRQLTSRRERVETWSRTPQPDLDQATPARRHPSTGVQPNIELSRPPVRIFRRSPAVEIENNTATAVQRFKSEETAKVGLKTSASARPVEAAIDVKRLTDQVIQAIDRRIVAQRERTGRL